MKKDKKNDSLQNWVFEVLLPLLTVICLVIFRTIVANRLGIQANGYLHIVLIPVLFFAICFFWQIEKAESSLIHSRIQKEQMKNSGQVLKYTMFLSCTIGLLIGLIHFLGSERLSNQVVGDNSASIVFRYIALMYLLIPCICSLFGYFKGNQMKQIPVLVRFVSVILLLISIMIFSGQLEKYGEKVSVFLRKSAYVDSYKGAGATFGLLFATFLELVILFVFFLLSKGNFRRKLKKDMTKNREQAIPLSILILKTAGMHMLSILLVTLPLFLQIIFVNKVSFGSQEQNHVVYEQGIFFGQYCTVWLLPFCLSYLLGEKVSGTVEEYFLQKDAARIKAVFSGEMNLQAVLVSFFAATQMVMARPICKMLYGSQSSDLLVLYVRVGSLFVLTSCFALTSFRLLRGIRRKKQQMISLVIASSVALVFAVIFSFGMKLGYLGLLITGILFSVVLFVSQMVLLTRFVRYHQEWIHSIVMPFGLAFVCAFVGWLFTILLDSPLGDVFSTVLALFLILVVYAFAMIKLIGFRKKEIILVPGGKTLVKWINFI